MRPFHGDRLFSLILAISGQIPEGARSVASLTPFGPVLPFYFNFRAYEGMPAEEILSPAHLAELRPILESPTLVVRGHRLKFDAHMLYVAGIELRGTLHCTQALARVEYNDHMKYGLDACAQRIGLRKDDAVERFIKDNHLWEWVQIPGKAKRIKNKFFDRVPPAIIIPYGEQDAVVASNIADHQDQEIAKLDAQLKPGMPRLSDVGRNEKRLVHTVIRMERVGVRIDRGYCVQAAQRELSESEEACREYKGLTGHDFKDSALVFQGVFSGERERWGVTEKGNPSFDSECLGRLEHPAAAQVLRYRDAKSKADFYHGFLWHADHNDVIHTSLNQDGADTGRLSSSEPNLNNMTSEESYECEKCLWGSEEWVEGLCEKCGSPLRLKEWLVRKAFIPFPGELFFMPDYSQIEYKLVLDLACKYMGEVSPLARKVLEGMDFHSAGVDIVFQNTGMSIRRGHAKTANFLDLFGGGDKALAALLKITVDEAKKIKRAMGSAAPEIRRLTRDLQTVATTRGYILNWFGRRYDFSRNANITYTAPNKYVQGGAADILKLALNGIDDYALGEARGILRLQLPIHDEVWLGATEKAQRRHYERVTEIMERVYPHYCIPLLASPEWSATNAADKRKGYPV